LKNSIWGIYRRLGIPRGKNIFLSLSLNRITNKCPPFDANLGFFPILTCKSLIRSTWNLVVKMIFKIHFEILFLKSRTHKLKISH